jgi:hypothetical protein
VEAAKMLQVNDTFCTEYGWHRDLKRAYGLSPEHIADRCGKITGSTGK